MAELTQRLTTLHTSLLDAISGYREGLKDAHGKGLTPLFAELITLHGEAADAVAARLKAMGAPVDDHGSLMGTFDRAVMKMTSLVTALDDKIIPAWSTANTRSCATTTRRSKPVPRMGRNIRC